MAYGGVRHGTYGRVQLLSRWALQSWRYINGKAVRNGVDLNELDGWDLFDLLDVEFEEYMLKNAELDGGLEKLRAAVSNGYDEDYHSIDQLYGSNDTEHVATPRRVAPDGAEDPLGRSAQPPRPYLPPTDQTDNGYTGLMPPVG